MNELSEFVTLIENTFNRPFGVLLIVSGLLFFLVIILLRLNTVAGRITDMIVISIGTLLIVTGAVIHTDMITLLKASAKAAFPAQVPKLPISGTEITSAPLPAKPAGGSGIRGTGSEESPHLSPLTPHLYYMLTDQFEFVWNDKGSNGLQHATVYRPLPPAGYKIFGYYIQGDYNAPKGKAVAVKISSDFEKEGLLGYPSGYTCIWHDEGGNTGGAIWRPIPPLGYRCLGDVLTPGRSEPDRKEIVCVRESLVTEGKLGTPIWDNKGSGSAREITVYPVDPDNPDKGFSLNLFQGYDRHISRSTVFSVLPVLRKDCISAEVRSDK